MVLSNLRRTYLRRHFKISCVFCCWDSHAPLHLRTLIFALAHCTFCILHFFGKNKQKGPVDPKPASVVCAHNPPLVSPGLHYYINVLKSHFKLHMQDMSPLKTEGKAH